MYNWLFETKTFTDLELMGINHLLRDKNLYTQK